MGVEPLGYLALYAIEGSAANEQDVLGVDMYVLLVGVLASALWRHVHHRSLKELEHRLLHALATHVARD